MLRADLTTPEGTNGLLSQVDADGRIPSALALNAGGGGPFLERDLSDQLRLVRLNVESVVRLAHILGTPMAARSAGGILLTSSIASRMPGPLNGTFAASEVFVRSFAHCLRRELAPRGVTVTALLPGPTDTRFFGRAGLRNARIGRAARTTLRGRPATVYAPSPRATLRSWPGSRRNTAHEPASHLLPDRAKATLHDGGSVAELQSVSPTMNNSFQLDFRAVDPLPSRSVDPRDRLTSTSTRP